MKKNNVLVCVFDNLEDTASAITNNDSRIQLAAELAQAIYRKRSLEEVIQGIKLPVYSDDLLMRKLNIFEQYISVLQEQADISNIIVDCK